jgi:hypothetical protein
MYWYLLLRIKRGKSSKNLRQNWVKINWEKEIVEIDKRNNYWEMGSHKLSELQLK